MPIHPAGYPFIAGFAVASLLLGLLWAPLFWIGMVLTAWCAYFFRDPERVTPLDDTLVISPADGRISAIVTAPPPAELGLGTEPRLRISVFMDVFSCHVNRSPMRGRIRRIAYRPGKFLNAELDKASEDNERNSFVLDTPAGEVAFVQIAGLVARRIVCFVSENSEIDAGERVGLIRFGSRVDVYLPEHVSLRCAVGQTAIAGETVLAIFDGLGGRPGIRVH